MQLMRDHSLDRGAFNRGYLYDFFDKLTANNPKEPSWGVGWQNNLLQDEPLYANSAAKKYDTALIDSLQEGIANLFWLSKKLLESLLLLTTH